MLKTGSVKEALTRDANRRSVALSGRFDLARASSAAESVEEGLVGNARGSSGQQRALPAPAAAAVDVAAAHDGAAAVALSPAAPTALAVIAPPSPCSTPQSVARAGVAWEEAEAEATRAAAVAAVAAVAPAGDAGLLALLEVLLYLFLAISPRPAAGIASPPPFLQAQQALLAEIAAEAAVTAAPGSALAATAAATLTVAAAAAAAARPTAAAERPLGPSSGTPVVVTCPGRRQRPLGGRGRPASAPDGR